MTKKLIIGITGASGAIYGLRLLETLRELEVETHLVISKSANITIKEELGISINDIYKLADFYYNPADIAAKISSGSFLTAGMIIAPCSIKTLSAIANSYSDNLIARAADVILKERRKLILMLRETPFTLNHIELMKSVTLMGGIVAPPVPAFYNNPNNINDLVNHSINRVLDLLDIKTPYNKRWDGINT